MIPIIKTSLNSYSKKIVLSFYTFYVAYFCLEFFIIIWNSIKHPRPESSSWLSMGSPRWSGLYEILYPLFPFIESVFWLVTISFIFWTAIKFKEYILPYLYLLSLIPVFIWQSILADFDISDDPYWFFLWSSIGACFIAILLSHIVLYLLSRMFLGSFRLSKVLSWIAFLIWSIPLSIVFLFLTMLSSPNFSGF